MYFTRIAFVLAGLLTFLGCGNGEQVQLSLYGEGTGIGGIHATNDEGQEIIADMESGSTAEGRMAAGSQVKITAGAHAGSHFVGFGGDCSGTSSPLIFQLSSPRTCSVRFDKD